MNNKRGVHALSHTWIQDLFLVFAFAALLSAFRVAMVFFFNNQVSQDVSIGQYTDVLWMGLKFDLSTAAKWVLISFLSGFICLFLPANLLVSKIRTTVVYLFFIVVVFLLIADAGFFYTYSDQFNQMVFGLFYDDTTAILLTVWKEYHPVLLLVLSVVLTFVSLRVVKYWMQVPMAIGLRLSGATNKTYMGVILCLLLFFLYLLLARGLQFSGAPLSMRHAFVSQDTTLNRLIPNPLLALWETFHIRLKMNDSRSFKHYWQDGGIQDAAVSAFPERIEAISAAQVKSISDVLRQTSQGVDAHAAKHIFVVLLESHSGWTVFPEYRQLGFSPRLSELAEKGYYLRAYLPASTGTIGAINTLVAGLPDSGLFINYEAATQSPLRTSIAVQFKKLGYTSRFFYGGLLGWQRLDQFTHAQGFDEVYGGGDMSAGSHFNEWGVDDEYLFRFVEQKVIDGPTSINFIMTTSNHPPYDIDLAAQGYPITEVPNVLKTTFSDTLQVLGHLWYADKQLGRFVESMEQRSSGLLFAITSDHTARLRLRFPSNNALAQVAVPFILYGDALPTIAKTFPSKAGSHIDIVPTLIALTAKRGFEYYSYGRNLARTAKYDYGIGINQIVSSSAMIDINQPGTIHHFDDVRRDSTAIEFKPVLRKAKAQKALSWYRIKQSDSLETEIASSRLKDKENERKD